MKSVNKFEAMFITAILILLTGISCTITNPLSELSWGTATIQGQVTRTDTITGTSGTSYTNIVGVPGAMIKTDSGTEQTYTNDQGYYSLDLQFRIGSAAKEKKIKVMAYDRLNQQKFGTISDVFIRDGLTIQVPPITWGK